jgi:hypothetical protein
MFTDWQQAGSLDEAHLDITEACRSRHLSACQVGVQFFLRVVLGF